MKKFFTAAALILLISMNFGAVNSGTKVTICHREGNGSYHEIVVSIEAAAAHIAHGDIPGHCGGGGGE